MTDFSEENCEHRIKGGKFWGSFENGFSTKVIKKGERYCSLRDKKHVILGVAEGVTSKHKEFLLLRLLKASKYQRMLKNSVRGVI